MVESRGARGAKFAIFFAVVIFVFPRAAGGIQRVARERR